MSLFGEFAGYTIDTLARFVEKSGIAGSKTIAQQLDTLNKEIPIWDASLDEHPWIAFAALVLGGFAVAYYGNYIPNNCARLRPQPVVFAD
jgi:hypothetical protein